MPGTGAVTRRQPAPAGWRREGQSLVRELSFRDFDEAFAFLERLVHEAVDYSRRPDICIFAYNRVRLTIANPHRSGITEAELRMARKVEAVVSTPQAAQRAATDGRAWRVPPTSRRRATPTRRTSEPA